MNRDRMLAKLEYELGQAHVALRSAAELAEAASVPEVARVARAALAVLSEVRDAGR